jgi:glycolate oxidase
LASYESLEKAGDAVSQIVASGILPGALEIMDALAIEAAEAAVHANYPPAARAILIVELEGDQQQVLAELERLMEIIQASGSSAVHLAQDEADRLRIWKGRKSAFSAVGRLSPDYVVNDGVVPRTRLGQALAEIERLGEKYGLRVANVFHAGDGNLHPLILYDGRQPGALEHAEELAGEILQLCIDLGGSVTGEHGIGMEKRAYLPRMFSEIDLSVMRELWYAVDAQKLSNRGKMFIEQ